MKKIYLFFVLGLLSSNIFSQTIKNIGPSDVATKSLDLIIRDDLVGATATTHFIYRLQGNFPYLLSGEINFKDAHVQLEAANPLQTKPIILQGLSSGGQRVQNLVRTNGKAKFTAKGIIFSGQTDQGSLNDRFIRTSGENVITIDSCVFDNYGQAIFRINGSNETIICSNSQFNRIGQLTNPDNGRFIDNRSTNIKLIQVNNCQISNATSRFWRNDGAARTIEKAILKNNTFSRSGQHAFDLGDVLDFTFENNIIVDPMYLGRVFTRDSTTARFIFDMKDEAVRKISIKNNNFFFTDSLATLLPRRRMNGDSVFLPERFVFSSRITKHMKSEDIASNFSEKLKFDNPPVIPLRAIITENLEANTGNTRPQAGDWNTSNLREVPIYSGTNLGSQSPIARYDKLYGYCYDSNSKSAKGSINGRSIGGGIDQCSSLTFLKREIIIAEMANLYPNPINDILTIEINSQFFEGTKRITISNSFGQQVYNNNLANENEARIDFSQMLKGIYFVNISNDKHIQTTKLLKL